MNILITGASGFIGRLLLETLKRKNYNIVGTVLNGSASSDGCKVIRIDLSNKLEASNFFYENKFDIIFHFAAYISPKLNEENPIKANLYNVGITKNIIDGVNNDCHLVFLSTDKVFDGSVDLPNEETLVAPCCLYGKLKYDCEELIKNKIDSHHIFRLPIVHSLGDLNSSSFIDKSILSIESGNSVSIYSNIERSFLRIDELIKLLMATIENNNYGTYHIGTEDMSYYDRLIQILDEKKIDSTDFIDKKIGNIIPKKQNLNTTKARNIFGFEFS
jgi:dTDP-4-dehydrorhamnose reductase